MNIRAAILSLALSCVAMSAYAAPPVTVTGTDGKQAAVKAASTASAATDPSLVVQISPNGAVAAAMLSTNSVGVTLCQTAGAACTAPVKTIVALDVATVTTGGTAVTALTSGHRTAGGFLFNPIGATINLCINEQGTASGTTSAGALTCIQPGQSYTLAPAAGAVSVITSDSSHPFSGYGLN